MTYQEAYDKLIKHAAEVEKWKQGMVKSHPKKQSTQIVTLGGLRLLDKQKLVEYLQSVIDSCKVVGNASDKAIIWQCEQILKNIELGMFDFDN